MSPGSDLRCVHCFETSMFSILPAFLLLSLLFHKSGLLVTASGDVNRKEGEEYLGFGERAENKMIVIVDYTTHTYTRTHTRAHAHTHAHTLSVSLSLTHTHTHTYIHIHVHTHAHTHTHTHTHIYTHII